MSDETERALAAASRFLDAATRLSDVKLIDLELAAWLTGKHGVDSPSFANPARNFHVQLASAIGGKRIKEAEGPLEANLARPGGDALLIHACYLAGAIMPDQLIEICHAHPGKSFSGQMLGRTSRPARLLELFDNQPVLGHAIITIAELVIVGRDTGTRIAEAESRWAALIQRKASCMHEPRFRNSWLRIAARQSITDATNLLMDLADQSGPDTLVDGARAVLARLVRESPEKACEVVSSNESPWDRAAWFDGLTWWFTLPAPAEPILRDLLNLNQPQIQLALVCSLTKSQAVPWLDRALADASLQPPLELARDLAPGIYQLRKAGLSEEAEKLRDKFLPLLPENPCDPGEVAPRDLFDILSASELPALVPWGAGPGLP